MSSPVSVFKYSVRFDGIQIAGNQFRGIDEEDSAFLAAVQDERREQERRKKQAEEDEIAAFKAYVHLPRL